MIKRSLNRCKLWLFCTSEAPASFLFWGVRFLDGGTMKKLAVGTAVILAILSLAACAQVGKGKAPPPVVTKG